MDLVWIICNHRSNRTHGISRTGHLPVFKNFKRDTNVFIRGVYFLIQTSLVFVYFREERVD